MRGFFRVSLAGLLIAGTVGLVTTLPETPVRAVDSAPEVFTLVGSGWGHGVGMSQWGAYGMAKEGMDAQTIVSHYFTHTDVVPVQDDMDIRVGVLVRVPSAQVQSQTLEDGQGSIEVTVGDIVTLGTPADVFTFTPVDTATGPGVTVQRVSSGQSADLGTGALATIRWAGTRSPGSAVGAGTLLNVIGSKGTLSSPGHRYRYGYFEMVPASTPAGPRLNVVNVVRLHDEYLYGIAEVTSSWPAAALQAQVISARSYALSKLQRGIRPPCACHLDDGTGPYTDQTFTGWGKVSGPKGNLWVQAVNATAPSPTTGVAVLYKGTPVSTFYTSSTGGITQASKDAWGGALPFATSVDDHWSLIPENPNASWTVNASQVQIAGAFAMPAVASLRITDRFGSGAVRRIEATGTDGVIKSMKGSDFLTKLRLKSTYIQSVNGDVGVPVAVPTADPAAVPAAVPTPTPAPQATTVTLAIGPTLTPRAGTRLKFHGRVTPALRGIQVDRQMLLNGEWKTVATKTTKANGRYRFKVKRALPAGTALTYRVVVVIAGAVAAQSQETVVTVR